MESNPFDKIYDVVIAGGGLSGIGCALSLGKTKNVIILERRSCLGWEIASAFHSRIEDQFKSNVGKELKNEMNYRNGIKNNVISPFVFEVSLEYILRKTNVDILLYTYPVDIIKKDNLVTGIVAKNKTRTGVIKGKVFIDATENQFLLKKFQTKHDEQLQQCLSIYYIFFNGTEKQIKKTEKLNLEINGIKITSLYPGFRNNEAIIEIQTKKAISETRVIIPEIISYLKENFEFLKNGLVSHISHEPLRIYQESFSWENHAKNFFPSINFNNPQKIKASSIVKQIEAGVETGEFLKKNKNLFEIEIAKIDCDSHFMYDKQFNFDVVIAGGGTAGAVAGIATGREGIKTAIVEYSTSLGGIGTGGGIHHYYFGFGGGIQKEIEEKTNNLSMLFNGKFLLKGWNPEAKKIVLEQMCKQAGVEIFYENCATDVVTENKRITGIYCASSYGSIKYNAEVFIDATGDADITAKAGAPYLLGREKDKIPQPFTLTTIKLLPDGSLTHINFDSGLVDSTDIIDLTRAKRQSMMLFKRKINNAIDIPLYICPIIGIRQSRQIIGRYILTLFDQITGAKFHDAISSMYSHYDNHLKDTENQSCFALLWKHLTNNFRTILECEIPYRCLIPENVDGLIVTGRSISLEPEAHYSLRMEKDMERLGEAAGIAASIAVKEDVNPDKISIEKLKEKLKNSGCLNTKYSVKPAIKTDISFAKLKQQFLRKEFAVPISVWTFSKFSRQAEKFLCSVLKKSMDKEIKFWSAVLLAVHGKKQSIGILLDWLKKEKDINTMSYISVIVILGKLKNKRATPFLHSILFNKSANVDLLLASLIALKEIKDKRSICEIEKFLRRKNIPKTRILSPERPGFINTVEEDVLWQIEIACAETLKALGKPNRKIVDRYINDSRAYVRNYAKLVI